VIVSLVGLPGCGKSTVGRQVARNLGWRFIDSDTEIEHRLGHSIRQHFDTHGEQSFRDIEQQVIADLAAGDRTLLATGGGAVLRETNRAALRARGNKVVYIRAQVDDLARRLRHDTQRPLLQGVDAARKLRELFAQRDPLYRELADYVIDTGRASVPMIANLLAMQLELGLSPPAPGASEPSPASKSN
jgi:shikimate kinase